MDYQINFPHLGISFDYVIKNFSIGGFTIAIYGLTMALGLVVGLFLTMKRAKETGQKTGDYIDLFITLIICGFAGARMYYCAFQWDYYSAHPLEILNFRGGGIAIYGGLIAGIIAILVFCKIKKLHPLVLIDTVVMGVAAGQIIGRWGNFFNREAFGGYTDGLFAMQLPVSAVRENEITAEMWANVVNINGVDFIQVHPTFLYEGMWNLALLIILFIWRNHTVFKGEMFCRYLVGYGIGRFWIESLRTDQLIIGDTGIPVSMVVSFVAVAGGIIGIILGRLEYAGKLHLPHYDWEKKKATEAAATVAATDGNETPAPAQTAAAADGVRDRAEENAEAPAPEESPADIPEAEEMAAETQTAETEEEAAKETKE